MKVRPDGKYHGRAAWMWSKTQQVNVLHSSDGLVENNMIKRYKK